jgi:hypothetical protein
MRLRPSRWVWLLLCLPLLHACSGYVQPDALTGLSRDQIVARMGPPDLERRLHSGSRLEYPFGPYGKQTWFVYLDDAGRTLRAEQVLTVQNFSRVSVGMAQDEVRELLGRPGDVQVLGRDRGMVWSYRYSANCEWFQVELTLEKQVRSAGYGEPPECIKGGEKSNQ